MCDIQVKNTLPDPQFSLLNWDLELENLGYVPEEGGCFLKDDLKTGKYFTNSGLRVQLTGMKNAT